MESIKSVKSKNVFSTRDGQREETRAGSFPNTEQAE